MSPPETLPPGASEEGSGKVSMPPPLDEDGLLCALVLAPSTYSRNRFFGLYEVPSMKRVLRRAGLVRSLVRQLARPDAVRSIHSVGDRIGVEVVVPSLGFRRKTSLSTMEHDLVVYLLSRLELDGSTEGRGVATAKERVETALARLGGLALASSHDPDARGS